MMRWTGTWNKYGYRKTELDGHTFDSKLEADRYIELRLLEKSGVIKDLKLQQEFELIPAYKKNGRTVRAAKYVADFTYFTAGGEFIVEDTKGQRTEGYRLKKKLFEYKYPYTIKEVTRDDIR